MYELQLFTHNAYSSRYGCKRGAVDAGPFGTTSQQSLATRFNISNLYIELTICVFVLAVYSAASSPVAACARQFDCTA